VRIAIASAAATVVAPETATDTHMDESVAVLFIPAEKNTRAFVPVVQVTVGPTVLKFV
jgi:hypothetical protein